MKELKVFTKDFCQTCVKIYLKMPYSFIAMNFLKIKTNVINQFDYNKQFSMIY
jgi:hypothetical protein